MSESNNNIPMRITQLEEATEYEEGMYYAVAKAGRGTKKISDIIANSSVVNANNGIMTFAGLGNFQHYGLNIDGSFLTNQKYRVSNNDLMTFDRDIVVNVKSGFKFGFIKFVNGTGSWIGWFTSPQRIEKGTQFLIQIARVAEITSEIANVAEFVGALTFENLSGDTKNIINPISPYTFVQSDIIQGVWENGYNAVDNRRICINRLFPVFKGNKFVYTPESGIDVSFGVFDKDNNSLLYYSNWITTTEQTSFEIPVDGYFFVQFRKTSNEGITPSEFSGSYILYYGLVEEVKNLTNDLTIEENTANFTYEQGTISVTGIENKSTKTVRTKEYILNEFNTLRLTDNAYQFGIHFYDANENHLSNTSWLTDEVYTIDKVQNCKYIRIVVSKRNNTDVVPSDVDNVLYFASSVKNLVEEINENLNDILKEQKINNYIGEKIPNTHFFKSSKILRMSYDNALTSQDIEYFNGYLFVAFSGTEQIKIYSLEDKTLLASIEISVDHGSGMQFSNEYYDETDDFPLLYVGGWIDNLIQVIRITKSENVWSAEIVRTLYIPTSEGYFMTPSVDNENNILYCYGYKDDYVGASGNAMKLIKCDLSDLTDNGDGTFSPTILQRIETPYMGVMQGRKYYNGRLYIGFAETSSPHNARLVVVDVSNGDTKTVVDMTNITTSENEGVCFVKNNKRIKWLYSDIYDVFELDF